MPKLLRVGAQTFDLGPPILMEGLFATISYRLEPDGRGSRFPCLINRLYAGRLDPGDVSAAARELEEVEKGLSQLPSDRAVWSLTDLRKLDDRQLPVNHTAQNVRDYFVASDGRPITTTLRDAVVLSQQKNQPVELASAVARGANRLAWLSLMGGFLWTIIGYLFFPDVVLHGGSDSSDSGGILLWPAGIVLFGAGAVRLLFIRFPSVGDWFRKRVLVSALLIILGCGLYVVLALRE